MLIKLLPYMIPYRKLILQLFNLDAIKSSLYFHYFAALVSIVYKLVPYYYCTKHLSYSCLLTSVSVLTKHPQLKAVPPAPQLKAVLLYLLLLPSCNGTLPAHPTPHQLTSTQHCAR